MKINKTNVLKKDRNTKRQKKTSQVPGQYLGYSLQTTRFLARLLEAEPGWTVSLEVFEDIGIETNEGNRIVEQVKSTYDSNPISDRAEGLWKTFSNWIDAVKNNDLPLGKTKFEIYVSQPRSGDIVTSFSNARTIEEARQALIEARNRLWGTVPDFDLKPKVSSTIKPYVSKVFETDETTVCKIVKDFFFNYGGGSPLADLKALMSKTIVPPEIIDVVLEYALGWVKKQTDLLLEQKKPASISVETFRSNIIRFIRKHDRRTILTSFAKEPTQEEIETDLKLKTYIRQLEIISCDYEQKIRAVRDFLQASVDRTQWSIKGWVHESSFDDFENGLIRTWENLKRRTDISFSDRDDITKGMYLYSECSLHRATLEGLEVPDHFTPGSFHKLSDKEKLGWHPEYKDKLKTVLSKDA